MAKLNLSVMDTRDRAVWRNGILGNRLTHAVAQKYDDDDKWKTSLNIHGNTTVATTIRRTWKQFLNYRTSAIHISFDCSVTRLICYGA